MAPYYNQQTIIFHNGQLIKAAEAGMDLYSQSLHYGYGVFEGIRSYAMADGSTAIFEAIAHYDRLRQSAGYLNLPYPWTTPELIAATYAVLQANGLSDAYIRPIVYGPANMSFAPNTQSYIAILAWAMEPFLGTQLLRVMLSGYERPNPKAFHMPAKACGHYVNSILASQQAKAQGYHEALLLDAEGHVAEAPGANVFLQMGNTLVTPSLGHILPGITRATVLGLCRKMGIAMEERPIHQHELWQADSAFFCGTAAEVVGIESINDYTMPLPWHQSMGAKIQQAYKQKVTGQEPAELAQKQK